MSKSVVSVPKKRGKGKKGTITYNIYNNDIFRILDAAFGVIFIECFHYFVCFISQTSDSDLMFKGQYNWNDRKAL